MSIPTKKILHSISQIIQRRISFLMLLCSILVFGLYTFSIIPQQVPSTHTMGQEEKVDIPILMYHALLKDSDLQNIYIMSPDFFESDLKYMSENGYTTITMDTLIHWAAGQGELPEKPIILTFDDGYYNNYLYAYPLLKEYNMCAVLSIIGEETDQFTVGDKNHAPYSHVTWDQVREMYLSGLVEIQNHTYNLHRTIGRQGISRLPSESDEQYKKIITEDVLFLQSKIKTMTDYTPTTFTYPFGFISEEASSLIRELGFQATLGTAEGVNHISRNPESLYNLKRILRPGNIPTEQFFAKIVGDDSSLITGKEKDISL